MSYRSSFDQLHYVDNAGDVMLSTGAFALLSLAQLDEFEAERVPGDYDAHVCAWYVDRASGLVGSALTNFCPPPVENDKAVTVTAPAASGQGVGTLSRRPLSRLFGLHFPEDCLKARVSSGSEDCPDAFEFSRALVRFVNKSKSVESVVEVHLLLHSVYHAASVYLAALVFKGDNRTPASAQFGLGCFQDIDDLFILCMGGYSGDKPNFHSLSFERLKRIVACGSRYLRRHLSARISGSGIGLVAASRAAVVAQVATSPDSLMPSRMAALSTMYASQHVTSSDITPIAAENKNARPTASLNAASMVSPVVVPPIIRTAPRLKKSNLDLNGRLVKKGLLVSWHGYRFHVSKVRMGTCYPVFSPVERRFFDCESVQVVG